MEKRKKEVLVRGEGIIEKVRERERGRKGRCEKKGVKGEGKWKEIKIKGREQGRKEEDGSKEGGERGRERGDERGRRKEEGKKERRGGLVEVGGKRERKQKKEWRRSEKKGMRVVVEGVISVKEK